jgi:hypothetical protein
MLEPLIALTIASSPLADAGTVKVTVFGYATELPASLVSIVNVEVVIAYQVAIEVDVDVETEVAVEVEVKWEMTAAVLNNKCK